MRRVEALILGLLILGLLAILGAACRDAPLVRVAGKDLGDDCLLVGYTFGWLSAPEVEGTRPPFEPMRQEHEDLLSDSVALSIEPEWGELNEAGSEHCWRSALRAASEAVDWYWCRAEPPRDFKEILIAYEAREIRCASATPAPAAS